jgi:Conjugative transposon protein TcpC
VSGGEPTRARVTIESRRLWTLRASRSATRWLLYAAAVAGIAATVRNAVAPAAGRVVRVAPRASASAAPLSDVAGEWYALSFARAYMTWSPQLTGRERSLAPFLAAAQNADAGFAPAAPGSEAVAWEAIAAAEREPGAVVDYTVAVGTAAGAVRYLAVAVARAGGGALMLARYPALVGAPTPARAGSLDGDGLSTLADPSLAAMLDRALRNYVSASQQNLAADLAPGAVVEPAGPGLELRSVARLAVAGPRTVLATVLVLDAEGDAYTLAYEVSLAQRGGRWEITRIRP